MTDIPSRELADTLSTPPDGPEGRRWTEMQDQQDIVSQVDPRDLALWREGTYVPIAGDSVAERDEHGEVRGAGW